MADITLEQMIERLAAAEAAVPDAMRGGLEKAGALIEGEAKEIIGHYQRADTGPFGAWRELHPLTKQEREDLDYPENEPLLRSGELRDHIRHSVTGATVSVGVPHEMVGTPGDRRNPERDIGLEAIRQEMGYGRSFLGIAAFREAKAAALLALRPVAAALLGLKE